MPQYVKECLGGQPKTCMARMWCCCSLRFELRPSPASYSVLPSLNLVMGSIVEHDALRPNALVTKTRWCLST